eukprot:UN04504
MCTVQMEKQYQFQRLLSQYLDARRCSSVMQAVQSPDLLCGLTFSVSFVCKCQLCFCMKIFVCFLDYILSIDAPHLHKFFRLGF